jgi:hypothetical protein
MRLTYRFFSVDFNLTMYEKHNLSNQNHSPIVWRFCYFCYHHVWDFWCIRTGTVGSFGDYFGGLLNPIIAFANLIVLVVISYQLADREDKRNKFALRNSAFEELVAILEEIPLRPDGQSSVFDLPVLLGQVHDSLLRFITTKAHIFDQPYNLGFVDVLSRIEGLKLMATQCAKAMHSYTKERGSQEMAEQASNALYKSLTLFRSEASSLIRAVKGTFA